MKRVVKRVQPDGEPKVPSPHVGVWAVEHLVVKPVGMGICRTFPQRADKEQRLDGSMQGQMYFSSVRHQFFNVVDDGLLPKHTFQSG